MNQGSKLFGRKSFKLRRIEFDDLEIVNELMKLERYEVGLKTLQLYYTCSNTQLWKCVENENGEIFAVDIGNLLQNGVDYGFVLIIHPAYRNQGISAIFKNQWVECPYMGSESLKSVSIYSKNILQCWRGKMIVTYGKVDKNTCQKYWDSVRHATAYHQVTLQPITDNNVSLVCKYDESIIKIDRRKFVEKWSLSSTDCHGVAVFDKKDNRCRGYGVIRNFPGPYQWGISPLYADNDDVASTIFGNLATNFDGEFLYVPCMAHQRVTNHFCRFLNLAFINSEIRDCNLKALEYAKTLDLAKVYATHDYWPV